jgi:hypothetical protein
LGTTIRRGTLPTDHFTIISNDWVRDGSLSWAARGLLAWLASHADGYRITEEGIISSGPSGRAAVKVMIKDLEEAGYLRRERTPIVTGGSTVDYILTGRESENRTLGNVRKSNPRPDQEEQDVSAGESNSGKSNPRSYREDQEKTKTPSVSMRAERATRLSEDFTPDERMKAWFVEEKLAATIDGRIEHQKFMNYWLSKPGRDGRKTDWRRTWMNWMLEASTRAERYGVRRTPGNSLAPVSGAPLRPSTTDQKVAQTLDLGRRLQAMEDAK